MNASAAEAELRHVISAYGLHSADQDYVPSAFQKTDIHAVVKVLTDLVSSGDRQLTWDAMQFAEAAALRPQGRKIQEQLWKGGFLDALKANLYRSDILIRHNSIHCLGRLGPRSSARFLIAALPWYMGHDPFALDGLLYEASWLTWPRRRSWRWAWLRSMVAHPCYLTRWAAAFYLWDRELGMGIQKHERPAKARQLLRRLAHDPHPLVRLESRWHLDEFRACVHPRLLSKPERCAGLMPDFFALRLNLFNYLGHTQRADFDVALLEKLIAFLQEHPFAAGMDIHEYWAAFAG
jgi:hypothetical protein